jgi:hypothetical protein
MLMVQNKLHDNVPFPIPLNFLLLIDVLMRYALLAIWGVKEEKWHGPEPPCSKLTPVIGWAHLVVQEMGTTGAN